MDVCEYISIRRAYNIVRHERPSNVRLTFEETAVLALLDSSEHPLPTSVIANWQHALRPTMTHRAKHLFSLGFIDRTSGTDDRRNVVCSITASGRSELDMLCSGIRQVLARGKKLTRIEEGRIKRYLLTMGQHYIQAAGLILVGLYVNSRDGVPISLLVGALGLLQPTVSMSVQELEARGLVKRDIPGSKAVKAYLTDSGRMAAEELVTLIESMVVKRRPRGSAS